MAPLDIWACALIFGKLLQIYTFVMNDVSYRLKRASGAAEQGENSILHCLLSMLGALLFHISDTAREILAALDR